MWRALTDPNEIPRWWGPRGTATRVVEMDVRPGGTWRFVSSGPDREDVTFHGEYLEIDPPNGYKATFMFDVEGVGPQGGPETYILEDLRGKTKVTSIGHMGTAEAIEEALATGMVGGAIETWDRLEALVTED